MGKLTVHRNALSCLVATNVVVMLAILCKSMGTPVLVSLYTHNYAYKKLIFSDVYSYSVCVPVTLIFVLVVKQGLVVFIEC